MCNCMQGLGALSCPPNATATNIDEANQSIECECNAGYYMDDYGMCNKNPAKAMSSTTKAMWIVLGVGAGALVLYGIGRYYGS